MTDRGLRARHILVVEDEYMLAEELTQELMDAGAEVIGPAPTIQRAMDLLESHSPPDGAVLDVNLGGELVFPLADTLIERGVPLVFITGYDPTTLPPRFAHVPICGKPINASRITRAINTAIDA